MRIAQVAPLTEAVPPKLYGGTERVVHWLTEELVALGHDVTLFASGDSHTSAKLDATWPKALRLDGSVRDPALDDGGLDVVRAAYHADPRRPTTDENRSELLTLVDRGERDVLLVAAVGGVVLGTTREKEEA